MLMYLSHITNVRNDWKVEEFGEEAHSQELAHTGHSCAIYLNERKRFRLDKVLEKNSVGNMFSSCDFDRADSLRELRMTENVIRMCRLFNPQRVIVGELVTHSKGVRHGPVLVCVEHNRTLIAHKVTKHRCT